MKKLKTFFTQNFRKNNHISKPQSTINSPSITATDVAGSSITRSLLEEHFTFDFSNSSRPKCPGFISVPQSPTDHQRKISMFQGAKLDENSLSVVNKASKSAFARRYSITKKSRPATAPPSPTMRANVNQLKIFTKFNNKKTLPVASLEGDEEDITPYCSSESINCSIPSNCDFPSNTVLKRVYLKLFGTQDAPHEKQATETSLNINSGSESSEPFLETDNVFCCAEEYSLTTKISNECMARGEQYREEMKVTEKKSSPSSKAIMADNRSFKRHAWYTTTNTVCSPTVNQTPIDANHKGTSTAKKAQKPVKDRFRGIKALDKATRQQLEIDIIKPLDVFEMILNK